MVACAGGGGGSGGAGAGGGGGRLERSGGELLPGFFSNYFSKGKLAILKANFGANRWLIFCQHHRDDFNSITGILER